MIVADVGGDPPSVTLTGTPDEVRACAAMLYREVGVVPATDAEIDASALLARVNGRRITMALSWRDVAKATGLSPSTLCRWAGGRGSPNALAITKLSAWVRS